ncbi:hypothetical protein [Clostridium sp. ZS2]|uniref:hypothetical protein n=1 Tax=Clostridium sp. ZS2 TaxID=2949988 RepID=UPI0020796913|nr:hypothetical protein [Clostridium sp. ZS2]
MQYYEKIKKKVQQSDFYLPLSILKDCKFDIFTTFITTIIFGQASICVSLCLSIIYEKYTYIINLVNNGDLLTISLALLGAYFGIILTEFKEKSNNYLKNVKGYVLGINIILCFICLIFLVIIKIDGSVAFRANATIVQITLFITSTFLSIYSLLLINCNKYIKEKEKENDSEEYLEDENKSVESIKEMADKNRTSEGDLL